MAVSGASAHGHRACLTRWMQGGVLSAIASAAIAASLPLARARIEARYGHLKGGALAVLALGRLGAGGDDLSIGFGFGISSIKPPNGVAPMARNPSRLAFISRASGRS